MGRRRLRRGQRPWALAWTLTLAAAAGCSRLAWAAPGDIITEITLQLQPTTRKEHAAGSEASRSVLERRLSIISGERGTVKVEPNGTVRARVPATTLISDARLAWWTHPGVLEVIALPDVVTGARTGAR